MINLHLDHSSFSRRLVLCACIGFTCGLPLFVLYNMVPAWLRTSGIDLGTIGLFALIQLPYSFKFVWAPFLDLLIPLQFGRRRFWAILSQIVLLCLIAALGLINPANGLEVAVALCVVIAFASASQDIVLDAFRRDVLPDNELGLGSSVYVGAYRVASLVPGALGLVLADVLGWEQAFAITAAFMGAGIVMVLVAREPASSAEAPTDLKRAIIGPFVDFFARQDQDGNVQRAWSGAVAVLAFVAFYKLGDVMATALATPFYLDIGFELSEIGVIVKTVGLWTLIIGGFIGGALMLRIGINKALWIFGVLQLVTIFGFYVLAQSEPSITLLSVVVGLENVAAGMGTAALTAFIYRECSPRFSGTQLAMLTSLFALARSVPASGAGFMIEAIGYASFFLVCAALAVPGMLLLFVVAPWRPSEPEGTQIAPS